MRKYQLKTYDKEILSLTEAQYLHTMQKIQSGKKMIDIAGDIIAVSNIASLRKIGFTEADMPLDKSRQLATGERKVNIDGPGYKAFILAKENLAKKKGI